MMSYVKHFVWFDLSSNATLPTRPSALACEVQAQISQSRNEAEARPSDTVLVNWMDYDNSPGHAAAGAASRAGAWRNNQQRENNAAVWQVLMML